MTITTTGDALLADIIAHPAADDLRLIYADYLEDHGQPDYAEFIRCQITLATTDFACHRFMYSCGEHSTLEQLAETGCEQCKPYARLKLREKHLLWLHGNTWRERDYALGIEVWNDPDDRDWMFDITYRRGLISEVRCTQDAWLEYGRGLVRRHPIEAVSLLGKEPWAYHTGMHCWRSDHMVPVTAAGEILRAAIASRIWDFLLLSTELTQMWKDYHSAHDATTALSAALILWAKQQEESA